MDCNMKLMKTRKDIFYNMFYKYLVSVTIILEPSALLFGIMLMYFFVSTSQ